MIFNLSSKKRKNKYNSSPQLTYLQNSLIMSIVDTPKKDLSNVDDESYIRKVHTYSVKSSSKIFSFSIHAMYNRVNCYQNKCLVLKSYIPGINSLIGTKRPYAFYFWKYSQLITWMDRETPLFNKIPIFIRIDIFQSQWYYPKETEAPASNLITRYSQWSYITNFLRSFFCKNLVWKSKYCRYVS